MDNQQILNALEEKGLNRIGSWALYDITEEQYENETIKSKDVSIEPFAGNLAEKINTNGILLALNWADRGPLEIDWSNFHDTRGKSNDYKIPYMIKETDYEGSYMTDLIKNHKKTDSAEVIKLIKEDVEREILKKNAKLFQEEIDIIQPKKVICFGRATEKYLLSMIDNGELTGLNKEDVIYLTHYSHQISIKTAKDERKKLLS